MSPNLTPQQRSILSLILLTAPLGVTVVLALVGWIPPRTVITTCIGILGATVGGITAGITARRFLAWYRNDIELLFGLGAVTAIGVVTMGYIYIIHLKNSFQTITDPGRIVEQTAIFVTFLSAQVVGILWAGRVFPQRRPEAPDDPRADAR